MLKRVFKMVKVKVLLWRPRSHEGEVIDKEAKIRKWKYKVAKPPLAELCS